MNWKLVATLLLLLFVMIFAVQNAETVDIRLLFWNLALPRWLLIFMLLVIGIIIGWFYRSMIRLSDVRSYKKKSNDQP